MEAEMPKDAMGRKTCKCGKFTYSVEVGCWLNAHGGQVKKGKKFACPDCFDLCKPNGKRRPMKEDVSEPEE
jgi:hypothetical protein